MDNAALELYNYISSWTRLNSLITDDETESLHLECKSPTITRMNRELKVHLSKALSGFSNTEGGVLLYGVATTKHMHSGLDVLSQLEPIGSCRSFERQIRTAIPALTTPHALSCRTKTILRKPDDTRGIVVVYIPKSPTDPLLSNVDDRFYFRNSDEFIVAPYEIVRRLFAATDVPDLYPVFTKQLVNIEKDGSWTIPIIIENRSNAFAQNVSVSIHFENAPACESIASQDFVDNSDVNPGKRIFMRQFDRGIHRGMPSIVGRIKVKMKVEKRVRRRLDLAIDVYAGRMRARQARYTLSLARSGFAVKKTKEDFLY